MTESCENSSWVDAPGNLYIYRCSKQCSHCAHGNCILAAGAIEGTDKDRKPPVGYSYIYCPFFGDALYSKELVRLGALATRFTKDAKDLSGITLGAKMPIPIEKEEGCKCTCGKSIDLNQMRFTPGEYSNEDGAIVAKYEYVCPKCGKKGVYSERFICIDKQLSYQTTE